MTPQEFAEAMLPYAREAARLLGAGPNFVPVALAQWDVETGTGTSDLFLGCHNAAGIRDLSGRFRCYPSLDAFVEDYVAFLTTDDLAGYYRRIVADARANASPIQIAWDFGESPWDAGHYTDGCWTYPGCQIVARMGPYEQYAAQPAPSGPIPAVIGAIGPWWPVLLVGAAAVAIGVWGAVEAEPDLPERVRRYLRRIWPRSA